MLWGGGRFTAAPVRTGVSCWLLLWLGPAGTGERLRDGALMSGSATAVGRALAGGIANAGDVRADGTGTTGSTGSAGTADIAGRPTGRALKELNKSDADTLAVEGAGLLIVGARRVLVNGIGTRADGADPTGSAGRPKARALKKPIEFDADTSTAEGASVFTTSVARVLANGIDTLATDGGRAGGADTTGSGDTTGTTDTVGNACSAGRPNPCALKEPIESNADTSTAEGAGVLIDGAEIVLVSGTDTLVADDARAGDDTTGSAGSAGRLITGTGRVLVTGAGTTDTTGSTGSTG
ncbi:hypothetical protein C7974DRAFT_387161 [Boeremia exigua]|uniref:uncharacterized protein n=1 Tax=Boeremia exigua TaxID=749465 RepID=UPI001E8D9EB6|nr:uncharacterized protein C7974DRAFT_387161 [Boeremia exigua]KAH6638731.1 hypothetical protein C7974DRAFT_387161 [Boeremia exigua]